MNIHPVAIQQQEIQQQLNQLINNTFGFRLSSNEIYLNTQAPSSYKPLYLAAFSGEKLIGFNAYIPHDCLWQEEQHVFYQSCWSAVDAAYRGQRIFFRLQTAAREPLRERGALGILGLPNERSGPILRGPLGYEFHGGYRRKTIVFPAFFAKTNSNYVSNQKALTPLDDPLLALKQQQPDRDILCFEDKQANRIWGKKSVTRKRGIPIHHFLVGGVKMNEKTDFQRLVRLAAKALRIHVMTFLYHESAAFAQLFPNAQPSDSGYLCWYPLQAQAAEITQFNCWVGLSDVF